MKTITTILALAALTMPVRAEQDRTLLSCTWLPQNGTLSNRSEAGWYDFEGSFILKLVEGSGPQEVEIYDENIFNRSYEPCPRFFSSCIFSVGNEPTEPHEISYDKDTKGFYLRQLYGQSPTSNVYVYFSFEAPVYDLRPGQTAHLLLSSQDGWHMSGISYGYQNAKFQCEIGDGWYF